VPTVTHSHTGAAQSGHSAHAVRSKMQSGRTLQMHATACWRCYSRPKSLGYAHLLTESNLSVLKAEESSYSNNRGINTEVVPVRCCQSPRKPQKGFQCDPRGGSAWHNGNYTLHLKAHTMHSRHTYTYLCSSVRPTHQKWQLPRNR
jgi:hypothetical protein